MSRGDKMKLHNLKIDNEIIDMKIRGVKNFEIRLNDRDFKIGDILFEREYNQNTKKYGSTCIYEKITGILPKKACYGLKEGYVILVTQPLYCGDFERINEFAVLEEKGLKLIDYLAKSLDIEDYCIWQELHAYDWQTISDFVLSKMPQGKCTNMMYKRL